MFFGAQFLVIPLLVVEEAVQGVAVDAVAPAVNEVSIIDLMFGAGPVVKGVLLILAAMSVVTWGIVVSKLGHMRKARAESEKFSDLFWSTRNLAQINEGAQKLKNSPVAAVFGAGHRELTQIVRATKTQGGGAESDDVENIERALRRAKAAEVTRLEKGTTFLATTASAGPFIGLFGTVWGIMTAFIGLSKVKSSSIQAVAPGISEALIATAIGLAAAIPAAIFFNIFVQEIKVLSRNMDMFSAEFLNIARRHFLR